MDACREYRVGMEAAVVITMTKTNGGVLIKPFVVKFFHREGEEGTEGEARVPVNNNGGEEVYA